MSALRQVLEKLSEETLFQMMWVVGRQARRVGLRRQAGKESSDLEPLMELWRLLMSVHRMKLLEGIGEGQTDETVYDN